MTPFRSPPAAPTSSSPLASLTSSTTGPACCCARAPGSMRCTSTSFPTASPAPGHSADRAQSTCKYHRGHSSGIHSTWLHRWTHTGCSKLQTLIQAQVSSTFPLNEKLPRLSKRGKTEDFVVMDMAFTLAMAVLWIWSVLLWCYWAGFNSYENAGGEVRVPPVTSASQAASPVARRDAFSSKLASLESWKTMLARTSASVNTCRHTQHSYAVYINWAILLAR